MRNYIKNSSLYQLCRILKLMKKNKFLFVFSLVISCIAYPAQYVIYGLLNKNLADAVIQKDMNILYSILGAIVVVTFLACIIDPLAYFFRGYVVRKVICRLRNDIFDHIIHLPMKELDNSLSGDMISVVMNDINAIEVAFRDPLRMFIVSLLSGGISGITIFFLNSEMALVIVGLGFITFICNMFFAKKIRTLSKKHLELLSKMNQVLVDHFGGLHVIRIFKTNDYRCKEFEEQSEEIYKIEAEQTKVEAILATCNSLLSILNFFGIFVISIVMIQNGYLDVGTVMAILTLQGNLTNMFLTIGNFYTQLQTSLSGAERLFYILDIPKERKDEGSFGEDINFNDTIAFNNVGFSYNNVDTILENFSLKFEKGTTVALVGGSGSGKTTVLKLLLRFYDNNSGEICIGNNNICEINADIIRKNIAYVSQEPYLFKGTILENIKYGRFEATDEEVIKAAKLANAHSFISILDKKYDTQLIEGGKNLSGGQRQRIAIARAFLKNSSIILLDEATSALDSDSEQLIKHSMDTLLKDRTAIIVAHRISTIQNANKIVVFNKGKIVEQGKHSELMDKKGVYYEMCTKNLVG